ncbi:MAG TPA: hypothetical protein VJ874_06830, partial [Candidatus Thermoplasmatota archaeon]|nr:hypothetical protein [Candidatus Thermoplasmatota archaeon]
MLRPVAAAFAFLLAFCLVLVPSTSAFESLPGGPHDDITGAAARESGFPESGVAALQEAVRAVDVRDNALEPSATKVGHIDATADYRPEHHCDRVPPAGDLDSINATVAYIDERAAVALASAQAHDGEAAVAALGELLHAVQDCMSHSNAVDLEDPQAMVHAVNGHSAAPAGLRLTGFQPGAVDTERPDGDPYPHADFAKDSADKNDEAKLPAAGNRTKFEAARALAIDASILALQGVLSQLDPAQVAELGAVDDGDQPIPRVGVPGPPVGLTLAALAMAAAW